VNRGYLVALVLLYTACVVAIGAAVMAGEIRIDNDRPEWVVPTTYGPPPTSGVRP
jgi:hypothetical protein